jgi:outer membrane protein, heavy metal efflux system
MPRLSGRALACFLVAAATAEAQTPLTWEQVRERFRMNNPALAAGRTSVDEAKASEITAYLRPNPSVTTAVDQLTPFPADPYRPLAYNTTSVSFSYLRERERKRELRRDSARQATTVAGSQLEDQERVLMFSLRSAFVDTLRAKAVLQLAEDNLSYYDRVLEVNRNRQRAGDISEVDLDRLELQRVQYESDVQTARVNLRTAKIQLLSLLNDRQPVDQFDVTGAYDYNAQLAPLEEFRNAAVDTRPDLRAAVQSVDKARTDHQLAVANGSADPILGFDWGRSPATGPPARSFVGVSVTLPIRVFDKNQGEKLRTQLDITRNERLVDAGRSQIFQDVDSAYASIASNLTLLKTYKDRYLQQAVKVRDTVSFAYQNGGASLLEFLNAQSDYRNIQLSYLNLIGSYMSAVSQINLAVGKEVIP